MLAAFKAAWADFSCIFERDPAARNILEVVFCYPGLQALLFHRFSHLLYTWGVPLLPRLMSHATRFLTGVDIHPGAKIGKGVFIDHGMGVVTPIQKNQTEKPAPRVRTRTAALQTQGDQT
jgi:serine O-acetyltransferase